MARWAGSRVGWNPRYLDFAAHSTMASSPGPVGLIVARQAVKGNYSVYFAALQDLLLVLAKARGQNQDRLEVKLRGLTRPKLLIIDEVGYLSLDDWEARMVFQLVSQRYERGSIILTSNKSYGDWGRSSLIR